MTIKKKAYAYTRVSTSMQVEGYSLNAQKERIANHAKALDLQIIREFSDEGKSGTSIEGREDFQRMIEYVKAGEDVDYIIVFKLSRFGRNTRDVLNTFEILQEHEVDLICIDDGINTSTEVGKFLITILSAVAEMERENIAAQTMEGRREKARQGKWNGGQAPYGYRLKDGLLIVEKEEAEVVKMIYDLYLNKHKGLGFIAKHLNDRGYRKTVNKNTKLPLFSSHNIKLILDNPVYQGKISYGRRTTEKVKGSHKKKVVKQKDYILVDGLHDAIIPEDIWNKTQEVRKKTGVRQDKVYSLHHAHKLVGILKCPVCGANMYGNVNRRKKTDGSGEYYKDVFYYACKHRKLVDGHKCSFKRQPPQDRVDGEIYQILMDAQYKTKFREDLEEKLSIDGDKEKLEKELVGLQKTKKTLETQIQNLNQRIDNLDIETPMYQRKYDDLVAQQDKKYEDLGIVQQEIRLVDKKIRNKITALNTHHEFYNALYKHILPLWHRLTEQEIKEIFNKYFERIEIFEDFGKTGPIVKKVVFKVPMFFRDDENSTEELVPAEDAKLIEIRGEMVPNKWTRNDKFIEADTVEWDKEGNVESAVLIVKQSS